MALMSPTPWNTYVWQFHPILLRTGRTCDSLIFPLVSTYLFLAVLGQLWYMRSRLWHAGPVVVARGILVPWPGIEPTSATQQGRSSTAGLSEKSPSDSLLSTEIWQRWTGCLNVPTVPFNWLWANPKDNYPRQARLNHVSLPKRALSFSEIRYGKWQTLLPLLALKKEAAMNYTAARKWVPPKAWRTLEVDPSLVKTPDENSAQLLLEFSALWNLEQNGRQSQAQISDLRKLEIISVCCLSH